MELDIYRLDLIPAQYAVGTVDAFFNVAAHRAVPVRNHNTDHSELVPQDFRCDMVYRNSDHSIQTFIGDRAQLLTLKSTSPTTRRLVSSVGGVANIATFAVDVVTDIMFVCAPDFRTIAGKDPMVRGYLHAVYNPSDMIYVYFELLLREMGALYNPTIVDWESLSMAIDRRTLLGEPPKLFKSPMLSFTDTGDRVLSYNSSRHGPSILVLSDNGRGIYKLSHYYADGEYALYSQELIVGGLVGTLKSQSKKPQEAQQ